MLCCLLIVTLHGSVDRINLGTNEGAELGLQYGKLPGRTLISVEILSLGAYYGIYLGFFSCSTDLTADWDLGGS